MVMQAKLLEQQMVKPLDPSTLAFPDRLRLFSVQSSPEPTSAHRLNECLSHFGLPYNAADTLERLASMGLVKQVGDEPVFVDSSVRVPVYTAKKE